MENIYSKIERIGKNTSEWYPPNKYVSKPIHRALRRDLGLGEYTSYLGTLYASATLHSLALLPVSTAGESIGAGMIMATLGTLAVLSRKNRKRKNLESSLV